MIASGASNAELDGALIAASRSGATDVIPELARAGANLNGPSGVNGWTPLMHAIHKGRHDSVKALLSAGADPNRHGTGGGNPLTMAAGYGYSGIVAMLLSSGGDPLNQAHGFTALDYAITGVSDIDRWTLGKCQTETVRILLDKAPQLAARETAWERVVSLAGMCSEVQQLVKETRSANKARL